MANTYAIKAETRDRFGKGEMHRLRAEGKVPGVVYGPTDEPVHLVLEYADVNHLLTHINFENTLIQLQISGKVKKSIRTIIREVQRHPYRPVINHLDFYAVAKNRPIQVEVPILLHGKPVGVKEEGGMVQHVLRELTINVLPDKIPEHIDIDISELKLHDSVHVSDLETGDYEVLIDAERTVVTIVPPVTHEEPELEAEEELLEAEEVEAGEEEESEEPEVIGKGREKESEEQ